MAVDAAAHRARVARHGEEGILYATLDPELLLQSRQRFERTIAGREPEQREEKVEAPAAPVTP